MDLQTKVNRDLLKYAVQYHIFCPKCNHVLDLRRAVVATAGAHSITRCTGCWDAISLETRGNPSLEVLDGRVLFGK